MSFKTVSLLIFVLLAAIVRRSYQWQIGLSNPSKIIGDPKTLYIMNEYENALNKTWAVLVAGSRGWDNYRHQADVLHMYQTLIEYSGLSKEKIILMIADDLVNSTINPDKGKIINQPDGTNLYHDLSKDYTGSEVSADNFLKVLSGDQQLAAAGKKVLNSKSDENVLVYYSDHGSPGFLLFPDNILAATELNNVLEGLAKDRKFGKMILVLESCYSGSIFDQDLLKPNLSIYAVTASNSTEESYAEFYDPTKNTFLSDVFTQNWIHSWVSCEKNDLTLFKQYEIMRNQTTSSHVSQYGDLELARRTKIDNFVHPSSIEGLVPQKCMQPPKKDQTSQENRLRSPNPDVEFTIFEHLSKQDKLTEHHSRLYEALKKARQSLKQHITKLGERISSMLNLNVKTLMKHDDASILDRKCYENLVQTYHRNCYKINEKTILSKYLHLFFKACNALIGDAQASTKIKQLEEAIVDQRKSLKGEWSWQDHSVYFRYNENGGWLFENIDFGIDLNPCCGSISGRTT